MYKIKQLLKHRDTIKIQQLKDINGSENPLVKALSKIMKQ